MAPTRRPGLLVGKYTVEKTDDREARLQTRRAKSTAGVADPDSPPMPPGTTIDNFRDQWPGNDPYTVIGSFQEKMVGRRLCGHPQPGPRPIEFAEGTSRAGQRRVASCGPRVPLRLGLPPLVAAADASVADSLDERGMARVQFTGAIDSLGLCRQHRARAIRIAAPDGVVALRALFDKKLLFGHRILRGFHDNAHLPS